MAAALGCMRAQLPVPMLPLRRWSLISGLGLKESTCVFIPQWDSGGDEISAFLHDEPGMDVARVATAARGTRVARSGRMCGRGTGRGQPPNCRSARAAFEHTLRWVQRAILVAGSPVDGSLVCGGADKMRCPWMTFPARLPLQRLGPRRAGVHCSVGGSCVAQRVGSMRGGARSCGGLRLRTAPCSRSSVEKDGRSHRAACARQSCRHKARATQADAQ